MAIVGPDVRPRPFTSPEMDVPGDIHHWSKRRVASADEAESRVRRWLRDGPEMALPRLLNSA